VVYISCISACVVLQYPGVPVSFRFRTAPIITRDCCSGVEDFALLSGLVSCTCRLQLSSLIYVHDLQQLKLLRAASCGARCSFSYSSVCITDVSVALVYDLPSYVRRQSLQSVNDSARIYGWVHHTRVPTISLPPSTT
jgi:hypothetical protein